MKRILVLAAVLAVFVSNSFSADLSLSDLSLSNFKVFGEASIYGEYDGRDTSALQNDVLLGLSFEASSDVKFNLGISYIGLWGQYGMTGGQVVSGNSENGLVNKLKVVLANAEINNLFDVDGFSATIGRQFYGDEDSVVMYFGVRHYQLDIPRTLISSLDAITLRYNKDNISATALYADLNSSRAKNMVLTGIDGKYSNIGNVFDIGAYFYNIRDGYDLLYTGSGYLDNYTLLGVRPALHVKDFTASLEFIKAFNGNKVFDNTNEDLDTFLMKIDAAYDIKSINLTPRATFFMAGGRDDKTGDKSIMTAGNYVPAVIGCSTLNQDDDGMVAYANTIITNVGVDYKYAKFIFSFDVFNYGRVKYAKNDDYFQSEIDLSVSYEYSESTSLFLGIGERFGKNINNVTVDFGDDAGIQAGMTYKF
ncbi:MAG: hypothetical protein LBL00_02140 [Endomicrobium sp.]|nr:hypothetical protein [Endomicrobium sp.]